MFLLTPGVQLLQRQTGAQHTQPERPALVNNSFNPNCIPTNVQTDRQLPAARYAACTCGSHTHTHTSPTHLLEQVLDLLLLRLNVLLQRVELLAHDAVLALEPQARLALRSQLRLVPVTGLKEAGRGKKAVSIE